MTMDKAVVLKELELDLLLASVAKLDKSVAVGVNGIVPRDAIRIKNYIKLISPDLLSASEKYVSVAISSIQKEAPGVLDQVTQEQAGDVLKYVMSVTPGILDQAFTLASSQVAYAVSELLSNGAVLAGLKAAGELGLVAIAEIASGFPFLGPVKSIMSGITEAMKDKAVSTRQLQKLQENCNEVYGTLASFAATIQPMVDKRPTLLQPLTSALKDCYDLVLTVKQKGSFMKYITAKETVKSIAEYDNDVSRAMQTLQTHIQLTMMSETRLTERIDSSAEFDVVKSMLADLARQREGGENPQELLKKLAEQTNESYEEVMNVVGNQMATAAMYQERNDTMHQKILEQTTRTNYELDSSKNFAHDRLNNQDEILQRMKQQQDRQAAMVYCDVKQNAYLAARVAQCVSASDPFIVVHCRGVGLNSLDNRDGFHGRDGACGITSSPAPSGTTGAAGMFGGHALRGGAGQRGGDATHGLSGREAENFEVHIAVESEIENDVIYAIKIVHGYDVNEERVQVRKRTRIVIHGKGGDGGNG